MAGTANNTQNDLLSVTAFISALFHAVLILMVNFSLPDIAARPNTDNQLEVVLMNGNNKEKNRDAELLSSADNAGGGNDEREGSTPLRWKPVTPSAVQSVEKTAKRVTQTSIAPDQIITGRDSEVAIQRQTPKPTELRIDGSNIGRDKLTTNARQLERERLIAKTSRDWENYQKRPQKRFLGPNTKGHGAAEYLVAWKKQVVKVGNANYPIQIKARGLTGTLIMSIEINRNGTISSIKVIQPSPHKLLNDAALRIVRDASPFGVFPDGDFFNDTDILVITRAIHFLPDASFDSTAGDRG